MLGGVDVVVDRLWKGLEKAMPGRAIIGIQDWHFHGEKTDAEGRRFLHLNFPAPPKAQGLTTWRYRLTLARRIPGLLRTLRQRQITTINVHFPTPNTYAIALLKQLGLWQGRLVLSFHGSDVDQISTECLHWKTIARHTDAITTCSADLAKRIEKTRLFKKSIQVINNAIDCDSFSSSANTARLPFSGEYILNVGSYVVHKGQDTLISAFSKIAKQFPKLNVLFIGASLNGDWLEVLKKQTEEINLQTQIYFLENQPQKNIAYYMKNAICLAQTSHREGLPLVLLEAAACETPIIATRVGGIPEIIPSDEFGLLFECQNTAELEKLLNSAIRNPLEAAQRAKKLKNRVQSNFSIHSMTSRYLDILEQSRTRQQ